jgi:hypothetical protein
LNQELIGHRGHDRRGPVSNAAESVRNGIGPKTVLTEAIGQVQGGLSYWSDCKPRALAQIFTAVCNLMPLCFLLVHAGLDWVSPPLSALSKFPLLLVCQGQAVIALPEYDALLCLGPKLPSTSSAMGFHPRRRDQARGLASSEDDKSLDNPGLLFRKWQRHVRADNDFLVCRRGPSGRGCGLFSEGIWRGWG